ncbi:MAG: hypothetical protein KC619_19110 [Myxococcales bacterium]|nr:hypothetical protein [Myxococcales bacterium]
MPVGNEPPDTLLTQGVFDAINNLTYSSSDLAFKDGSTGTLYYLYVEKVSGNVYKGQFVLDTPSAMSSYPNPWGKIPSGTADILLGGSYVSASNTVDYSGTKYRFRVEWDDSSSDTVIAPRQY